MEYSNLVDVTDFIRYYENVASEDFCDLLIDEFSGYVLDPDNPKIGEPLGSGRRWGVPLNLLISTAFIFGKITNINIYIIQLRNVLINQKNFTKQNFLDLNNIMTQIFVYNIIL